MVLDLLEGCELVINGESWRVERLEPYWGKVILRPPGDPGGQVRQTTTAALEPVSGGGSTCPLGLAARSGCRPG